MTNRHDRGKPRAAFAEIRRAITHAAEFAIPHADYPARNCLVRAG